MSGIPLAMVHPIHPYGDRILLVHMHLYQVTFSLCWPFSYGLDELERILWFFNITFQLSQFSLVTPSMYNWFLAWYWYHLLLFLIIQVILVFASLITWPIITVVAIRLYIWPQIRHWFICPPSIFRFCFVGPSSDHSNSFFQIIFHQWSCYGGNSGVLPIYILVDHHGGWYLFHPVRWLIHLSSGHPYTLTKNQTLKPIWAWCSFLQNSMKYLCFEY